MKVVKEQDLFPILRKLLLYSNLIVPYDQWDDTAFRQSNAPDFCQSFRLSMLQNEEELLQFLQKLPLTILNKDGVFSAKIQSKLLLKEASIAENFKSQYSADGKSYLYYLLNTIIYDNNQYFYHTPCPLGYILRYVPNFLNFKDMKRQLITQLLFMMQDLHGKQLTFGPEFNADNFTYNPFFELLQLQPPSGLYKDQIPRCLNFTQLWLDRKITTFEYLYIVNLISGRRQSLFHSPLFPWVQNFATKQQRDLKVSQFIHNKGYEQVDSLFTTQLRSASEISPQALAQYLNLSAPPQDAITSEANHTSGPAPTDLTLFCYLCRRAPLSLVKKFVRPKFVARQFCDKIGDIYKWSPEELLMEFYTEPRIFTVDLDKKFELDREYQHIFGPKENILGNIDLTDFGMTPEKFVEFHMKCLNDNENIQDWLDQVFGIKSDGYEALSYKNLTICHIISNYGMQSSTFQMFNLPHPSRLPLKSKDNLTEAIIINGKEKTENYHNFDETIMAQQLDLAFQNASFNINCGFLPQTSKVMLDNKYLYSLDRLHLAQVIYQINSNSWNIQNTCFLTCLDSRISVGQAIANQGDDTLSLMIAIIQPDKLFRNQPLLQEEVKTIIHRFSSKTYYYNAGIKYNLLFKINQFTSLEEGLVYLSQNQIEVALHGQRLFYQAGIYLILNQFILDQFNVEILDEEFLKETLKFQFKQFQLNDYLKIIGKLSFDQSISDHIFDNLLLSETITEQTSALCSLCNSYIVKTKKQLLPKNYYLLYKAGLYRMESSYRVIYETIVNYQITKQLIYLSAQHLPLYKMLCQLQLPVTICLDILIPIGMKFIQQGIFARYDSEMEIKGLVEDITIMMMRLNDSQIIGKIFETLVTVLLQTPDWVFQYFYTSSNLANKLREQVDDDQISSISNYICSQIDFKNIENAITLLLQYMLEPMLQMMNQQQCTMYFEKLVFPLFEARYQFLTSYLYALRSFNVKSAKYDLNCISFPLFQAILFMKYLGRHINADVLCQSFFAKQIRMKKYLIDNDNYITDLKIEKLEQNFALLQLLLINPFHSKQALQHTLLHIFFACQDIMETENVLLYEKACWTFVLCSNKKAIQDFQRISQLEIETTYNYIQQMTQKVIEDSSYTNIIQQEHQRSNKQQRTYFFAQLGVSKQISLLLKQQLNVQAFEQLLSAELIDIVPGNALLEVKQNWLLFQYDIQKISSMLLIRFVRNYKLITETENLFKDYQSPESKFHIFSRFLTENIIKQLNPSSTITDLLNKISGANDGSEFSSGYEPQVSFNNLESQQLSSNQTRIIYETFDLNLSQNNQSTTQSTIEKLSSTEYLITTNRNFQIFNTSFIGKHQKSPLVLDYKYEFTDSITCTCKLPGNRLAFGTVQGDLTVFDYETNKIIQNIVYRPTRVIVQDLLKEQKIDGLLKYYQQPYIQAGLEDYVEYCKKNQPFQPYQRLAISDNVLVTACGGQLDLFDLRSGKSVANIQTLEYSKFQSKNQQLGYLMPSQTACSLKITNNKILSGSENFISHVDLRNFVSETLFSDQQPFMSVFNNFGAIILQENQTRLFEHPAVSDTPLCRALGRQNINQLFNQQTSPSKACSYSKGILNVILQNTEKQQLSMNQVKVENIFKDNYIYQTQPIKLDDRGLSIYQSLHDIGEVKTMAYDALLDCWLVLGKMGIVGLMK